MVCGKLALKPLGPRDRPASFLDFQWLFELVSTPRNSPEALKKPPDRPEPLGREQQGRAPKQ